MSENDVPVSNQSDEDIHAMAIHGSTDGARGYTGAHVARVENNDVAEPTLEELDATLEKLVAQKRWSDVIRTTLMKAERVSDPEQSVELYAEAGRMCLDRSPNPSEAIKCFTRVLKLDPTNREAIARLKEMYEKRRDWERLLEVRRTEVGLLDDPDEQLQQRVQIAMLATERLRKPAICIELWQDILTLEPNHPQALASLATLYERSRDWEPLAQILERQSEGQLEEGDLVALLTKLGSVYADKLGDDNGAIQTYKRLLALRPEDRRAQEQIKKRYVSTRSWDELESFYEASDKWEEFIRTLERAAELEGTNEEDKIALQFRVAQTWLSRRQKPERAARAYEKVLALVPNHLEAAEALSPIYEAAGDAKRLVAALAVRLEHAQDPYERAELLKQSAALYQDRLRAPERAFESLLEAFTLDPFDDTLREQVGQVVERVPNERSRLFEAYQKAIDAAEHPGEVHALRVEVGQLLRDAGELEQAIAHFAAVCEEWPDDQVALTALSQLYEQTGRHEALLKITERRAAACTDQEQRRELAYRVAALYRHELSNPEAAIAAYQAIPTEFGPQEQAAYEALEDLYAEQQRWSELAESLNARLVSAVTTEAELVELKFRLAALHVEHLSQPGTAMELAHEVLTMAPDHGGALSLLESLLSDEDLGGEAARTLEPLYEQRGQWPQLVGALQVWSRFLEETDARIEMLARIADLQLRQLGDALSAYGTLRQAFQLEPTREDLAQDLEALALSQERVPDFVGLLSQQANLVEDPNEQRRLRMHAARLQEQLGDPDGAVNSFQEILLDDPSDTEALLQLEHLYRRAERWEPLMQVLRQRSALSHDSAEQEALLVQIAFIHFEMLGDAEEAIRVYGEVLEINPLSLNALAQLDELYEVKEMWSELADNVARQLSITEDEDRQTALMLKLAGLREERLEQIPGAIEIYREVLNADPAQPRALAALQRLLERPEYKQQIADVLEPIYREAAEYKRLVGVYEIQLSHSPSVEHRVELLHQMAALHESILQDLSSAFDCYARALAEEPADSRTQSELERLAGTLNNWDALAQVYEAQAPQIDDMVLGANLFFKAAQLREQQLGDQVQAVQHYQRVLDLDPRNVDAASALERLYHGQENYEALAKVYLAKASMMEVPDDKREHLFRAAALYEDVLGRPEQAISVYQRTLAVEPDDLSALDRLIELHSRQGDWAALLDVFEQKADAIYDVDEKKALFLQIGRVYEEHLGQPERATEAYQRVLELDPQERSAIARLDALYAQRGDWHQLLAVLEREAEQATEPSELYNYRYRIGELYETRLDEPYRAVEVYREVLEGWPDHEATRAALERMVHSGREPLAAAQVLEPMYRSTGEAEPLIGVLEVLLNHDEDPALKLERLHQIAELHEVHVGQAAAAFEAYARALALNCEDERTLDALERLAEALGNFERLAAIYDGEVENQIHDQPVVALDLALRLAQIFEVRIGDADNAITRYQTIVDHEPGHEQALYALDRLYEATERWPELVAVLRLQVEHTADPERLLQVQFRLAEVLRTRVEDGEGAIGLYREVLVTEPEHQGARSALESWLEAGQQVRAVSEVLDPLYRGHGEWANLIHLADRQLQVVESPSERVALIQSVIEIAEHRLGDVRLACEWALRAVLEDPTDTLAFAEADRLAGQTGSFALLADTYARAAEAVSETGQAQIAADIGTQLADVYIRHLRDVPKAEETYRYVVGLVPTHPEALSALDRIYTEHGAGEALATVLRARIEATPDELECIDFSHRLAEVLYNEVGRTREAISVLTHILDELDPEHEPSLRTLQNIYTATKDWRALYDSYARELKVALGDAMRSEILGRMAHLASAELGEPDKAVDLLRQVLELLGEEPAALNALGNLYALQENWSDLVDVLEREVAVTDDDAMRVAIYSDLGRIWYEKLQRDRNALDSWERVLDIEPGNMDALLAIAAVHRHAGAHSDLVDALHRLLDTAAEQAQVKQLEAAYMELGELYAQQLSMPQEAVEQYRHALEVAPRNFAAMDALEEIFAANEEWTECVDVLHGRADAFEEPTDRIQVLLQIAELWEDKLQEPDGARKAYDQILQLDPSNEVAFGHLEELHREAGRFEELVELYIVRVESAADVKQRVRLLHQVANVYERDLQDKNQAFDALLLAWQQDFSREDSADALERLAGLTLRWNEVLTTANGALQAMRESDPDDPGPQTAICLKCARWYAREGHPDYAIPYLQQVLKIEPQNRGAILQMADVYRQTEQWESHVQWLSKLSDTTEDPTDRAEVLLRIGGLYENQFGAPQQAIAHYKDALAAVPGHEEALAALEGIYRKEGEWGDLVEVLQRQIDALEDDPQQCQAVQVELGAVFEQRLQDSERAIQQYQAVLAEEPHNLPALKGLERLYTVSAQWPALRENLETQLETVENQRDQVELLIRIATMWEEEFLQPERASQRLEEVLELDPLHNGALAALARIYRTQKRWDDLIRIYERHIDVAEDNTDRAELFMLIGGVCKDQLKDLDRAVDAYLSVVECNPSSGPGLRELARLYELREDYSLALDTMERLLPLLSEAPARVDLLAKMGDLYAARVGDRVLALEYFQRATDLDGSHLPSLMAMKDIHLQDKDYHAAARVLERAVEAEESDRKKAILRIELGNLYDGQLHDREAALAAFEQARDLDPDNVEAALPLVDEYVSTGRYADVEPLLQMLVRSGSRFSDQELQRHWATYGRCADALGNSGMAVQAYGQAFALDASDIASLMGLARAHYEQENWDEAFKHYQMLLVHHRTALSSEDTTDAFYRLGVIKRALGEQRKALNMFEKALEEDPIHLPTLEAMVELHSETGEWEQVIHFKKRILDGCDDMDGRFELHSEIGELWQSHLDNPAAAIEAYTAASELRPEDHKMLHKLLQLFQQTGQWEAVIQVIHRISAVDDRPAVRAKNAYTIGVILRDELKDPDGALAQFNEALDLDALRQLKAFEAINKVLTQQKNWKELERAFRKMLRRVTGQGDQELEFNLWHNLGVIYRDRLKNMLSAAEAFAMASRLQPQNLQEHQILAEIYAMVPGRTDEAIAEHQVLLKNDPNDVRPYRALYKLYFDARAYDKAWCVAATLNYLQQGDAEHRQFYEQYKVDGPIRPRSRLTDELWVKELFHPEENFLVGKIFESVTPAMLQWHRVTDKRLDLKKKQEVVDLANTTIALARTFGFVNQVFGMGFTPRLFVCPDRPMGLEYATTIPPASVCGSTLLSGVSPLDVIFIVGRHLAFYRPEHYIRTILQTKDQLKLVLAAAMRIAGADIADSAVENTANELRANGRMQPAQLELLMKIGRRFADAGARADMKAWMRSTELTAARAGFLMCNDIGIASRLVQSLPPLGAVELSPRERIQDLVLFSVSESYFRLREALGITISVG